MRKLKWFLLCFLALSSQILYAQNTEVRGKVTDDAGEALQGVSVTIKGTKLGTTTGADGSFTLMAPANGTLVISSVGMETSEVRIQNRSIIGGKH